MLKLVSSWSTVQSLPEDYVFPTEKRPGEVINHGVSETLMDDTMKLSKEFFDMPDEDKASVYSEDPSDVYGLQVFKDGQWIGVEPITNAIVVNIGHRLQIISNGKFKSAEHRAVTNSRDPRTNVVTFISPSYKYMKMEDHDFGLCNEKYVPESYIFPQKDRPGELLIPICHNIPVIDLGKAASAEHPDTIKQILKAGQQFGFFQVVNHGISKDITDDAVRVLKDFFGMPAEEKVSSTTANRSGWVYTSSTGYSKDGVHLWRENIKHPCHPLEECMQLWPQKRSKYREAVAAYLLEMGRLSLRILKLICEGLGLEPGYFEESSEVQLLSANMYPPCPDPSLTLGLLRHCDPSLITILFQGNVSGLQVFKDGHWIGVGALSNAFLVNIGNQLEIISNGKLRSAEHRVVTNSSEARTTIATFINPSPDCIVEPATTLLDDHNPPHYKPFLYKDFVHYSKAFGPDTEAIQKYMKMEDHDFGLCKEKYVPESYVFPEEDRPGELLIPIFQNFPVIDLGKAATTEHPNTIKQIVKAGQEFGCFQVQIPVLAYHQSPFFGSKIGLFRQIYSRYNIPILCGTGGLPWDLGRYYQRYRVFKDFLGMPAEEKASSTIANRNGWVYTASSDYAKDGIHLWRDNIKHPCYPLECMQLWPEKPSKYREVVAAYLVEIGRLSLRILKLICEGLGLEPWYFEESSEVQVLSASIYPPCPDPSLTLGLLKHSDPSLITILFEGDVSGFQLFKDGPYWIGVGTLSNAFLVNIGNQLEIISNGKLKSAEHRVVTNSKEARTTIATLINPPPDCIVEPAAALVNSHNPPRYKPCLFKDFVHSSKAFEMDQKQVSSWFQVESVSDPYIFPAEERPGKLLVPLCKTIPVVDLGNARNSSFEKTKTINQILEAAQDYGFFQVINHGISEDLVTQTASVFREFFNMPEEDKERTEKGGWIYTSGSGLPKYGAQLWRDNIKHPCHPLEESVQRWPEKPTTYQKKDLFDLLKNWKIETIISNGKLKSAEHRAVTNSSEARATIATFINPSFDCIIEPAKALVNDMNPQLYKPFQYKDFVSTSNAFGLNTEALQKRIISDDFLTSLSHRKQDSQEIMDVLISNWSNVLSLPKSYVFPSGRRPGNQIVPLCKDIPVVDLGKAEGVDRSETVQKILKASQQFGFFQVINHGVPESVADDAMNVFKDFFGMPAEYKATFYSNDPNKSCRLYTSTLNYDKEEVHYWRDNFTHHCHPLEINIQDWPENPTTYWIGTCNGVFDGELGKIQLLSVNHHIPCPDPSLTLGMPEHCDPNLISMIHQCDISGLQVFKDGEWIGVEPLPNAFVVIAGLQLRVQSLPKSYVLPSGRRPGNQIFPLCKDIPVVDLGKAEGGDRSETVQKILKASQKFGFFQVINHGIPESVAGDAMKVLKEFFGMPAEYKASFYSNDPNKSCRLCTSTLNYDKEEFHYWRDNFTHRCHPLEGNIQHWPEHPTTYRHCDPNLISTIHQCDVSGFQVFKDGKWIGVEPLPNAFLVIPGLQLRVISNGMLTSPLHRVLTHPHEPRTTIGTFLIPSNDIVIEPAGHLVDATDPPLYRAYNYNEFLSTFIGKNCDGESALKCFRIEMEGMALLVSSWCENVKSIPADYVMPPEKRAQDFSVCKDIPVIDLGQAAFGRADVIEQIMKASQEYGFFQVINHGVSEAMMQETMKLYREFFALSAEENAYLYSADFYKGCRLYTSGYNYAAEDAHYWKDTIKHPCYPLENHIQSWPEKPARYRELVGAYSLEARKLILRILDLMAEGLGLEEGYFGEDLTRGQGMAINHYPVCPDPTLTIGIGAHCDPYLITILQQDVYGLQIKKDGEWIGIDPLLNGFVVFMANQMEIISNGKIKSAEHRAVNDSTAARISLVTFLGPAKECVVHPAKALVSASNPQRYKAFTYLDFVTNYLFYLAKRDLLLQSRLVIKIEVMASLVSSWSSKVEHMPDIYVMPPERRPGNFVSICKDIPVIDLAQAAGPGRAHIVQQIIKAGQEYGFFQVINHGVSEEMMQDTMSLYKEFFDMPAEDKASLCSDDTTKSCKLYTSGSKYATEEVHYWRDTLRHPVLPIEEHMTSWPEKPARYREVVAAYSMEVKKMGMRLLDLIGEGLGLEEGYFIDELGKELGMAINHYPRCPDPSLAMGIPGHFDPNLITILQQEVYGLQICKDGQWLGVEALPNAFAVNMCHQMQVISNGKLKGAEHRAVLSSTDARTSIATFLSPSRASVIKPAKAVVSACNPPQFRDLIYKDFLDSFMSYVGTKAPRVGTALTPYELQA
ncbi:hypothetical protein RJ639_009632 [Escallonia herrerae]|uniref:Fe2OG dioxygenase domain-containing protein n=1 Tax=Escallonia herrerae TaxID=1293975 RepID=A0AA89ATL3_9ASTE|nr:hypothetical protein RJ639_009632 [Escallonia herrerae]